MEHSSRQAQWLQTPEAEWVDDLPDFRIGGDVRAGSHRRGTMIGGYGLGSVLLTGKGIALRAWFWEKYSLAPIQVICIRIERGLCLPRFRFVHQEVKLPNYLAFSPRWPTRRKMSELEQQFRLRGYKIES